MIRAFIVMKIEHFKWITQLIEYLNNNLIIAHYCGFDIAKKLPAYSSFDRFVKNFSHQQLDAVMTSLVRRLQALDVISCDFVGIDSMPLFANTKFNNPNAFFHKSDSKTPASDNDCRLGVHAASNALSKPKVYFYYGYKEHVAVDCSSGLPIASITTPADMHDSKAAISLLTKANAAIPLYGGRLLADKGYDVKDIYNTVHDTFAMSPYIPLNKRNTKKNVFSNGRLLCQAGLMMNKDGTSHNNGCIRQRFYCPLRFSKEQDCPCKNPKFYNGRKHRGCQQWVTLPSDLRLSIDRASHNFKITYKRRTWCERYNSRFKASGNARLWVRSMDAVANMNILTHVALLAVALCAVLNNRLKDMKCIQALKRSA